MRRLAMGACAVLLLASRAAADELRGQQLVRDAQAAMAAGDNDHAVELLKQARVEWPGSPLVANTLADALRELGRYPEAITEYERGQRDELQHHALFNGAVTRHLLAEQQLEQAGVPADAAALPEGPQPEMLAAIEQSIGQLERATESFLDSLEQQPDEAARESIEALGRRTEALGQMAEELRRRQEQQQKQQDQDQKNQDQKQDQQQDQKQDQQKQDQQQQDQQQQDQEKQDEQQQKEPEEGEPQGETRELSPEEVQQLLDRLDQLEKQARELQKAREAVRRKPVEKDW